MIFAREITDDLTSLVKKIDAETGKNKSARMGSFVVFLSNDEGMEEKLKDLVKKEGLKHTILTLDNPAGPRAYNITKDADVTVVLYNKRTVKANHAYKKGEFKAKDIGTITKDISKILPGEQPVSPFGTRRTGTTSAAGAALAALAAFLCAGARPS